MTSVAQKIKNRIKGKGRGWAFTPKDFLDLATRNNVGQILHRLTAQGFIRQVSRGVYDYPRKHSTMGDFPKSLPPSRAKRAIISTRRGRRRQTAWA